MILIVAGLLFFLIAFGVAVVNIFDDGDVPVIGGDQLEESKDE